jgi:hypothetical protein
MTELNRDVYDPVPHSHVVAAGYLRGWEHDKKIAMRLVGVEGVQEIGVRDAGVRKNFYRRERPTGETIYDIERSLELAETAALPVITGLPAAWPLDLDDKGKVGQFFALQHLRGMAFRQWHERQVASVIDDAQANPEATLKRHPGRTETEVVDDLRATMTSDTYRLTNMVQFVRSVGIVFTSMHWSLVEFDRGQLATSDHPVVVWPLTRSARSRPTANDLQAGVIDTLEVFGPISPTRLLLMTWRDEKSRTALLAGEGRHLATANAFVIANAHTQWFHEPGVEPWTTRGDRPALGPELLTGYDLSEAAVSQRRAATRELANAEMRRDMSNDPVDVFSEDALPEYRRGSD